MKKKLLIAIVMVTLFATLLVSCHKAAPGLPPNNVPASPPAISQNPPLSASQTPPAVDNSGDSLAVLNSSLTLKVMEPADAATLTSDTVTVKGQTKAGATVCVNDQACVADSQGNFSVSIALEDGPYAIDIIATDDSGSQGEVLLLENVDLSQAQVLSNIGPTSLNNEITGSVPLSIIFPADGADINSDTVTIKGQTVPDATICLDDLVDVADSNGNFSIPVALVPGVNAIDVIAINDNGDQSEIILMVNCGSGS
jgi:hypothetical protein